MKFQYFIAVLALFAVACDDVASSGRRNPGASIQNQSSSDSKANLFSGIHREMGAAQMTYKQEIAQDLNRLPKSYRVVPDMLVDNEGKVKINITRASRATKECGTTRGSTLAERLKECAKKNGELAVWDGVKNASSTEGTWALAFAKERSSGGLDEIWQDTRTGMLWSYARPDSNWCKASGNIQAPGETEGFDCSAQGSGACTEWTTLKELPNVEWRLPTRNDFLQADLDGIRFVLDQSTNSKTLWTATSVAEDDDVKITKAWTYNMANGTLTGETMSVALQVRCIGSFKE